jgi:predicted oxidoreductase
MQALIGTTTPSRVQDSADATSFEMTREEWYEIYISAGNRLP